MLSFKQKILITYIFTFLTLIALSFPLASNIVRSIASKAMEDRANELIAKIKDAPNEEALIQSLKDQKSTIFFRVSVIDNDKHVLYDSHTKHILGEFFDRNYIVEHPEVLEAFKEGVGYNEDYSKILDQKFSYLAKAFNFHGRTFVMRTAFPYKYFNDLAHDFEIGLLGLVTATLLLFSIMTWLTISHFTKPIQQIISAVTPYQEGKVNELPEIELQATNPEDEFSKLAMTLNSMSEKIQDHIDNLTEERNEKLAILESLIEGVIAIDPNMIVTYANEVALKQLNVKKEEIIGHKFTSDKIPEGYALTVACQQEKIPLTETLNIINNGSKTYFDVVAAPKEGGGAIFVMQDKTSHYKLLEMRKDFIANASHELKTPITIIRGFAETLHDNPDLPEETMVEVTGKIVRNCQRMTGLIKDLLTLSDVENLPLSRLESCSLPKMTMDCARTVQEIYPAAKIAIHSEKGDNLSITADPSLIELAMINLLENAAKYSTPPAEIRVEISRDEDKIRICISDKGIGIPQQDLEHIFDRFYTVDKAHSQKMGGSGLGLSIVKTIVNKHFGDISVASEVGKGTTFTLLLPTSFPGYN